MARLLLGCVCILLFIWCVSGIAQDFGHKNMAPGNLIHFKYRGIFVPDREQFFPADGKIYNISYYHYQHPKDTKLMVLIVSFDNRTNSYQIHSKSDWIAFEYYAYTSGWSYLPLANYISVYKDTTIAFHFSMVNPFPYKRTDPGLSYYTNSYDKVPCDDNSTLHWVEAPSTEMHVNEFFTVNDAGFCAYFAYSASYISDGTCLNVTLTYSYDFDFDFYSSFQLKISGYPISRLEEYIYSGQSFCWIITAPSRYLVDSKDPIVAFQIIQKPEWGHEKKHSDGYTYCDGGGVELIDVKADGTQRSLFNICSDTSEEWSTYYSFNSNLMVKVTTDESHGVTFIGEGYGSIEEDVPRGYYDSIDKRDGGSSEFETWKIGVIVFCIFAAIIIIVFVVLVVKHRNKNKTSDSGTPASHNRSRTVNPPRSKSDPKPTPAVTPTPPKRLPPLQRPTPTPAPPGTQPSAPPQGPTAANPWGLDPAYPGGPPPPYGQPSALPPIGGPAPYPMAGPSAPPQGYAYPPTGPPLGPPPAAGPVGAPGVGVYPPLAQGPSPFELRARELGAYAEKDGEGGEDGSSSNPEARSKWKSSIPGPAVYNEK